MSQNGSSSSGPSGDVEGEDQEDSSSSNTGSAVLEEFRKEWKREIEGSPQPGHHIPKRHLDPVPNNIEDKARVLFRIGVEMEEKGELYDAIQYYRRAVQLVPDIEFRLFQVHGGPTSTPPQEEESDEEPEEDDNVDEGETPFDSSMDLLTHLQSLRLKNKTPLCAPLLPTNMTQISALPMEIFLYILRWVVSSDMDMRSLEMCSRVCRGFYICCRDQEIWRIACARVWGVKCGTLKSYSNWREMYIFRPRLQFGGCYISKTTYIRHGENSFQDQYYRPWHLVIYYRYLRFFPDGRVLMLTTSEEPVGCVGLLKTRNPPPRRPPVFTGFYRQVDTTVSIVLSPGTDKKRSRPNSNQSISHTFHLELEIQTHKKSLHGQLVWRGYSIFTQRNGVETNTPFDLIYSKYPPFWYSRVKSYTAEAVRPLSHSN